MVNQKRTLWLALLGLAVGATMLHYRIHPPSEGTTYLIGNIFAMTDLFLVSLLFLSHRTAVWGVLLNGFIALIGIILMADFSISATLAGTIEVMPSESLFGWLMLTTLPDIAIAFADFLVGMALYRVITQPK